MPVLKHVKFKVQTNIIKQNKTIAYHVYLNKPPVACCKLIIYVMSCNLTVRKKKVLRLPYMHRNSKHITLPETNITPIFRFPKKESSFPTTIFQGLLLSVSGRVNKWKSMIGVDDLQQKKTP